MCVCVKYYRDASIASTEDYHHCQRHDYLTAFAGRARLLTRSSPLSVRPPPLASRATVRLAPNAGRNSIGSEVSSFVHARENNHSRLRRGHL